MPLGRTPDGYSGAEPSRPIAELPQLPLTDSEFSFFRDLASAYAGIKIADYKRNMVFRRVSKRLRALGIATISDYCRFVSGDEGHSELQHLINVLTTNKTSFFREKHHFDHLAQTALPTLLDDCEARGTRRLRLWSAGCSSGEEPYSIAMTLHETVPNLTHWDARILATDIDTEMIEMARRGIYDSPDAKAVPPRIRHRFVGPLPGDKTRVRMSDDLCSLVDFRSLNLLRPWPMKRRFDAIFCRNVVIYFDKPTQRVLFDRFADILREDCFLYIGHAESLYRVTQRFRAVGQGVYRKIS